MFFSAWPYGWISSNVRKRTIRGGIARWLNSAVKVWEEFWRNMEERNEQFILGPVKPGVPLDIHGEMSGPWLEHDTKSVERVPTVCVNL